METSKKHLHSLFLFILAFICLVWSAAPAFAADPPEKWQLTLGGSGTTTTVDDSQSAFGLNASIGRTGHLLLPLEAGLRQGIAYASPNGGSTTLSTRVYVDATLVHYKAIDFFAGGNVGLAYGNMKSQWRAAPEVGLRCWLWPNVAVIGRVEYPFDLNDGSATDTLEYFVGLQVAF